MKYNVIRAKRTLKTGAAAGNPDCWKCGLKIDLNFCQAPSAWDTLSVHLFNRDYEHLGSDTVCMGGQPTTKRKILLNLGGWNPDNAPEMLALVVIDDCPTWYAHLTLTDSNTAAVSQVLLSVFDSPEIHYFSTVLWNHMAGESYAMLRLKGAAVDEHLHTMTVVNNFIREGNVCFLPPLFVVGPRATARYMAQDVLLMLYAHEDELDCCIGELSRLSCSEESWRQFEADALKAKAVAVEIDGVDGCQCTRDVLSRLADLSLQLSNVGIILVIHGTYEDIGRACEASALFARTMDDDFMFWIDPSEKATFSSRDTDDADDETTISDEEFEARLNDFANPSKTRSGAAEAGGGRAKPRGDIEELRRVKRLILGDEQERPTAEERLRRLVGLDRVKKEIEQARLLTLFTERRRALGLDTRADRRNHMLFYGNPGTGKTTVAKLIGEMYHDLGLLSKGHTVEVNRSKIVGEYIGETEQKVEAFIKKARGGVLFIDEAYSLTNGRDDSRDFGKQVLNALLPVLSEPDPDMIVILAGYEDKMQLLLQTNQGLLDRFPLKFHFDDYDAAQLLQIATGILSDHHFTLTPEATELLRGIMERAAGRRDQFFGNGRWVHNLVEQGIEKCLARRVMAAVGAPLTGDGASQAVPAGAQPTDEEALQRERRLFSTVEACDVAEAERTLCDEKIGENPTRRRIGFTV